MGVSGSGKTTIGRKLAESINIPFYDADDYHPEANVVKMTTGLPLNDEDRLPWLKNLKEHLKEWKGKGGAILACSALKKSYREILNSSDDDIFWIYLEGSKSLISNRMKARKGHYMPSTLLDSQFATLETPSEALKINIEKTPTEIVNYIQSHLHEQGK